MGPLPLTGSSVYAILLRMADNLAVRRAGGILDFYQKVTNPAKAIEPYAKNGVHIVRAEGEALMVGAALAFLEHKVFGGSLDYKGKYPIDGIIAGLGILATMGLSANDEGLAVDARNITADVTAIFAYRQAGKYFAAKERTGSTTVAHGEGDDLLRVAEELGL